MHRILGHYVATSLLLLRILEASLIAAGSGAAFYYMFATPGSSAAGIAPSTMILSFGIVALMHSGGLYQSDAVLNLKRTLWRVALITLPIFALAVWTTGELHKHAVVRIYPYRWQWTLALTAIWLLSAVFLRVLFRQIYRSGILTRRVLLVGRDNHAANLAELAASSHERFRLVGQISAKSGETAQAAHDRLASLAKEFDASEIVISVGEEPLPWEFLASCRFSGVRVTDYLDFCEREGRRLCIESLREDWIALADGFGATRANARLRRVTDVVVAVAGFAATAPVFLLTALAIKLEDGGAVFYRQVRVGLEGRPFVLLKFRSMRGDAESDGRPAWAEERDSRITQVGRLIRKLRIDELPQLYNILRGDMALIGPRPERPYFVAQFSQTIPFYDYRHLVRPGITGWAQVSYRYGASFEDTWRKLSYDLYYIKNRSLFLDIVILLKTMGVVVRGEGAR